MRLKDARISFVFPVNGTDQIVLRQTESIEAYCPGSYVLGEHLKRQDKETSVQLKCLGKSLKHKQTIIHPESLRCKKWSENIAQYTGWDCYDGNKEFEIGFRYKKSFLSLITGCFDEKDQITLYTVHTITKSIAKRQRSQKPYHWVQGSFFNVTGVSGLYSIDSQRSVINDLLGLTPNSTKYVSEKRNSYLTRGRFASKADFIYGSQQGATYYLLNAVPQWHNIKKGNWQILQQSLRKLAARRRIDLTIYTGVHQVLRLPHEHSGKFIKLYLSVEGAKYRIPIPEYVWKIAYDKDSAAGIAFVVVNNPYIGEELYWYKICKNICFKLRYVKLNLNYAKKGYVYCCDINDLRRRVKTIPNFTVHKLLI